MDINQKTYLYIYIVFLISSFSIPVIHMVSYRLQATSTQILKGSSQPLYKLIGGECWVSLRP